MPHDAGDSVPNRTCDYFPVELKEYVKGRLLRLWIECAIQERELSDRDIFASYVFQILEEVNGDPGTSP